MDAIIKSSDKRRASGLNVHFLNSTTFEDILAYFEKDKKAFNVILLKSAKHKEGGAFYTREEYLQYMEQEHKDCNA